MAEHLPELTVSLLRQLVASQFPHWSHLSITRVTPGGWDNRTFRLGTEMSMRIPSAECYAAQVHKEHRWLPDLAPLLPLAIPVPIAKGQPGLGYPWHWSVYRWLEGVNADSATIDPIHTAEALANFLVALWKIDATGGPPAGRHNFFRGGSLATYDLETRAALAALQGEITRSPALDLWETALAAAWRGRPVWVHGDVHPTNLLVHDGRLSSVIDFGCMGVGDPACDLTITWTFFSGASRRRFREVVGVDDTTWARSRGWALWKGLITLAHGDNRQPRERLRMRNAVNDILLEHQRAA